MIQVVPAGATVRLTRGEEIRDGAAPFDDWLVPGAWQLSVSKDGYEPDRRELVIGAGEESTVAVELVDPRVEAERKAKAEAAEAEAARLKTVEAERRAEQLRKAQEERDTQALRSWLVIAGGAAVIGGGALAGFKSGSAGDRRDSLVKDAGFYDDITDAHDEAESLALTANVLYGIGGATVLAGGAMMLLGGEDASPTRGALVRLAPLPGGFALTWGSSH